MRGAGIAGFMVALVLIGGCDNGDDAPAAVTCTVAEQNAIIKSVMQEWYLFDDQLRNSDPAAFPDSQEFLKDLVADVVPADRFSFLTSEEQERDAIEAAFVGFGFQFRVDPGPEVRLLQVFGEYPGELPTPAAGAGWKRGFRLTAIDGVSVADIIASKDPAISDTEAISEAFGPREVGFQVTIDYLDNDGVAGNVTLAKADIRFTTVPVASVFDVNGAPTGYLLFRSFADPSFAELDAAFRQFINAGVREVVVDVRYNGGGLVSVAQYLGNLLAAREAPGQVFYRQVYNSQKAGLNSTTSFVIQTNTLAALDRVVFITTGSSASASELVPNGLKPWVETVTVGATSFGKPVGSLGFAFCGQVLRPTTFQSLNALGEGDYFDGIAPDCPADDDPGFALGDPAEPSISTALAYVATGTCPALGAADAAALRSKQAYFDEQARKTPYRELDLTVQ